MFIVVGDLFPSYCSKVGKDLNNPTSQSYFVILKVIGCLVVISLVKNKEIVCKNKQQTTYDNIINL